MFTGLTHQGLADVLAVVEPVELKGVTLLRQCPPSSFFPTGGSTAELVEATVEIIEYTRICEASLRRLQGLHPIPVTSFPMEEYSL